MRKAAALLSLCLAFPAAGAEPGPPMTAAEFDAATVGRTLYYNSGGLSYGVEQYLPGRKVIWAFLGDDCRKGEWYEDSGFICFVYEDNPDPQCWTFFDTEDGLLARFRGDPFGLPLIAVEESPEPMACLGPNVGV
ncbi:hypothetical protein [Defluviimonas sp. SAOS-178_SWC]|uniref:hypothetical protein n=1 Tax=Defluviimonas sp. SAOS-178_SWC TaxID=3121287 RepID=UPI00322160CC